MEKIEFNFDPKSVVCFDTETTGLDNLAEICQIGISDINLTPVFYKLIKPTIPISEEASLIHGITDSKVKNEKTLAYYWDYRLSKIFDGKVVMGYNVFYDVRMLLQTIAKHGLDARKSFSPLTVIDVMHVFKEYAGMGRWFKLETACNMLEVELPEDQEITFHDAFYDACMTMELMKAMMSGKELKVDSRMGGS